ncbi:MAG TPA: hypothetical protein VLE45_04725 [Burkholderiaceae bacterium]|nr:hypothetical protein [Burkholderiaceae bacterium]
MFNKSIALLPLAMLPVLALAMDRAITLSPVVSMSWGYVTPGTAVNPARDPAVGFWQRASGAKAGVGVVFVGAMEYQLPETPPSRVRSATFQFSGKQSQCTGGEPVVIDVYAYPGNGRGEVADATAGVRVAQMRADCTTNPAFNQPIDVTQIVRQLSVPSGIRHVGFNMRKANNRQGPGLFGLSPGKLTVVVADQEIAQAPMPVPSGGAVRDVRGEYAYLGQGVASVAQNGTDVRILATWTPAGPGPHYEIRGKLAGDTIVGQWYSMYHRRGWYRYVGRVLPNGDIDQSQSDDPSALNMNRIVLTRTSAAPVATLPPTTAPTDSTNGLIKALNTLARGGGKAARDQAKAEAVDGLANLPPPAAAPG